MPTDPKRIRTFRRKAEKMSREIGFVSGRDARVLVRSLPVYQIKTHLSRLLLCQKLVTNSFSSTVI